MSRIKVKLEQVDLTRLSESLKSLMSGSTYDTLSIKITSKSLLGVTKTETLNKVIQIRLDDLCIENNIEDDFCMFIRDAKKFLDTINKVLYNQKIKAKKGFVKTDIVFELGSFDEDNDNYINEDLVSNIIFNAYLEDECFNESSIKADSRNVFDGDDTIVYKIYENGIDVRILFDSDVNGSIDDIESTFSLGIDELSIIKKSFDNEYIYIVSSNGKVYAKSSSDDGKKYTDKLFISTCDNDFSFTINMYDIKAVTNSDYKVLLLNTGGYVSSITLIEEDVYNDYSDDSLSISENFNEMFSITLINDSIEDDIY